MTVLLALRERILGPRPITTADKDIRYLYYEIVWASILGGIATFNAAYAIRLGASRELVAWMAAAPALVLAVFSIPSARFLARRRNRKFWITGSLLIYRAGYVVIGLMPLLVPANPAT